MGFALLISNRAQLAPSVPDYNYYPYVELEDASGSLPGINAEIVQGETLKIRAFIYNNGSTDNTTQTPMQYTYYAFRLGSDQSLPNFTTSIDSSSPYNSWTIGSIPGLRRSYGFNAEYPTPGTRGCEWLAETFKMDLTSESGVNFGANGMTCGIVNQSEATNGAAELSTIGNNSQVEVANGIEIDSSDYQVGEYICGFLAIRSYDYAHRPGNENKAATYQELFSDRGVYDSLPQSYRDNMGAYYSYSERPQRRLTVPRCVRVVEQGKRPKIQVWGADVRTGEEVATSTTRKGTALYGSWAEYGILAQGNVKSASGAGLSAGQWGRVGAEEIGYNKLTFANTPPQFGVFGTVPRSEIPRLVTTTNGSSISGERSITSLVGDTAQTIWTATDVTITSGEIPLGKTVVINASGTVTVKGDITYADGPYTQPTDIPQLIIKAGDAVIDEHVDRIDAWLIAPSGYVSTCGRVDSSAWLSGLHVSACNQRLELNGLVISSHLYARRTYGAEDSNPGVPAEVINLRPETYLWAYGTTRDTSTLRTTYIRELPPRF